jgi:hypothetical protein
MKKKSIYLIFMSIVLTCCIEPYNAKIDGIDSILVVEGIITDETTQIKLSKSTGLDSYETVSINHALMYIECEDGNRSDKTSSSGFGVYNIENGKLNVNAKYRLVIHLDGEEYHSSFIQPALSPPFEVSLKANDIYNTIDVYVSTSGYENQPGYYLWSYKEDWEIHSPMIGAFLIVLNSENEYILVHHKIDSIYNHYYCWQADSSRKLILETTERLIENTIKDKFLKSFMRYDERISVLYRIRVTQNTIHKEAYDFFSNLQKNVEQTGSIFAPIPSEIVGNIKCLSNPKIPVIGYIDVSTTSISEEFLDNLYYDYTYADSPSKICSRNTLINPEYPPIPGISGYILLDSVKSLGIDSTYVLERCVDCLKAGGTKNKPLDWPNDNL